MKQYPDDKEIQKKNNEINEAFIALNRELNPDFDEDGDLEIFCGLTNSLVSIQEYNGDYLKVNQ